MRLFGWMRRRWPSVLGGTLQIAVWAKPAYSLAISLLDWRGRADAAAEFRQMLEAITLPPVWLGWPAFIVGLALIYWDMQRQLPRLVIAREKQSYQALTESALRERVSTWLPESISAHKLVVSNLWLFGSVLRDHYPTSDVDLVVELPPLPAHRIAACVRKIRGLVTQDFERTFGHKLHVTFFCANEVEERDNFLAKAGDCRPIGKLC